MTAQEERQLFETLGRIEQHLKALNGVVAQCDRNREALVARAVQCEQNRKPIWNRLGRMRAGLWVIAVVLAIVAAKVGVTWAAALF
jgi:hypothetical protein